MISKTLAMALAVSILSLGNLALSQEKEIDLSELPQPTVKKVTKKTAAKKVTAKKMETKKTAKTAAAKNHGTQTAQSSQSKDLSSRNSNTTKATKTKSANQKVAAKKTAPHDLKQAKGVSEASAFMAVKTKDTSAKNSSNPTKKTLLADNSSGSSTSLSNPFTGTSLSATNNSAGVTSTKVKSPETKSILSNIAFTWVSYNAIDNATLQNASPTDKEVRGWQMPTISYNFDKNVSFSVMPQFFNSWFGDPDRPQDGAVKAAAGEVGETQPYSLYFGNLAFTLGTKELVNLGAGFKIEGSVRYDAPTSERANLNGEYGENWDTIALDKSIGKVDLQLMLMGRFYMQRYNTSSLLIAGSGPNANLRVQNSIYRDYELLNIGYNVTSKFCVTPTVGAYNTTYYADPDTNRDSYISSHRVVVMDFSYTFSKRFTLSTGLWEDYAVDGQGLTWGNVPFNPVSNGNNSEVYLQGTFKIL